MTYCSIHMNGFFSEHIMVVAIQQSFWQKRLFHPGLAFPCTLHDQIFEQKSESVSKKVLYTGFRFQLVKKCEGNCSLQLGSRCNRTFYYDFGAK